MHNSATNAPLSMRMEPSVQLSIRRFQAGESVMGVERTFIVGALCQSICLKKVIRGKVSFVSHANTNFKSCNINMDSGLLYQLRHPRTWTCFTLSLRSILMPCFFIETSGNNANDLLIFSWNL